MRERTEETTATIKRVGRREVGGVAKTDTCEDEKKDGEDPLQGRSVGSSHPSGWRGTHEKDVDGEAKDDGKGAHGGGLRL